MSERAYSISFYSFLGTATFRPLFAAAQSLSHVMALVGKEEIAMPSAMRLLRLSLGRKCEKMDQCEWALRNKVSYSVDRRVVAKKFGVFMCDDCISCHFEKRTQAWTTMYIDRCGEICGPFEVPTVAPDDDGGMSNEVKRILTVFEKLNGTYVEARSAKRKRDAEVRIANRAKKAKKFTSVIERLRRNLREKEWVDIALATDDNGDLRSPIAQEVLGDFIKTPSKATSSAIAKASKQLRKTFDYLYYQIRFHDFSAVENFMDRDGRWDEEEFTPYWLGLKDELRRRQVWLLSAADVYHNRLANMQMVKLLKQSRGSHRSPVFYDQKRVEAVARVTMTDGSFIFAFSRVVARAVPLVPENTLDRRRLDMQKLFTRFCEVSCTDVSSWQTDYNFTVEMYELLQRQMDKYVSLCWVSTSAKRDRIRRDKDLMVRIREVRDDFSNFISRAHPLFFWLLDSSDFSTDAEIEDRTRNGFDSLLSWHEKSVRRAASMKPQRDIRLYF